MLLSAKICPTLTELPRYPTNSNIVQLGTILSMMGAGAEDAGSLDPAAGWPVKT